MKGKKELKKKKNSGWLGYFLIGVFFFSGLAAFLFFNGRFQKTEKEVLALERNLIRVAKIEGIKDSHSDVLEKIRGVFLGREEVADLVSKLEESAEKRGVKMLFRFEDEEPVLFSGKKGLRFDLEVQGGRGEVEGFVVDLLNFDYLIDFETENWELFGGDSDMTNKLRIKGTIYTEEGF